MFDRRDRQERGASGERPERSERPDRRKSQEATSKKRKNCPFIRAGIAAKNIDYKDAEMLSKFITDRGKILPRRITGVSAKHQRGLTRAIKRARYMALMAFASKE